MVQLRSIAIYGKGGIGKSTITSNVSAALADRGHKVLQIGCDPKHDSTRLLLGGIRQPTVMEQLEETGPQFLDNVLYTGYKGIKCIECGGPEPGVGCAGRGVIRMVDLLRNHGLRTDEFDYVFFDVLGDVVCGGFAVPMRDGYANEVYIVTSGEYASLYAANNIARGLRRFSTSRGKLAGVIGNERGTKRERELVASFARIIGTEMTAFIPRSGLILEAELQRKTVVEYAPDSALADAFRSLAAAIESSSSSGMPTPMPEDMLEDYVSEYLFGSKPSRTVVAHSSSASGFNAQPIQAPVFREGSVLIAKTESRDCGNGKAKDKRSPLFGCALAGAYSVIGQIRDTIAIMDAPRGCAFTSLSMEIGAASILDHADPVPPNLLCINMSERDAVFGSEGTLEASILKANERLSPKVIFLVTSCASGIIGNDTLGIAERLKRKGIEVVPVVSDGVLGGDFYAGMSGAHRIVAEHFIDEGVEAADDTVNIVGEQNLSTIVDRNFHEIDQILCGLGLKVNCRFVRNVSVEQLKNFRRARLNIPLSDGPVVDEILRIFKSRYGMDNANLPLPFAFRQTEEFTLALSSKFGKEAEAERVIAQARSQYEKELARLSRHFSGKKVLISSHTNSIDWLISTLFDVGASIQKVCLFGTPYYMSQFSSNYNDVVDIEYGCTMERFEQNISALRPDLVLANSEPKRIIGGTQYGVFPASPAQGFLSGIEYARRWAADFNVPFTEGWRYGR